MVERASFWHSGIPDCASAMVSWIEGEDQRPLPGLHGTGFFVRRGNAIAFVTSRHCLGPLENDYDEVVKRLAIPYHGVKRKSTGPMLSRDWVRFDSYAIPKVSWNTDEFFSGGDLDLAVLKVSTADDRATRRLLSRAAKLPPTGDWFATAFRVNGGRFPGNTIVQGFPRNGTETSIDYDTANVIVEGATFRGTVTGRGDYPHTWRIEFQQEHARLTDLDGVSGSPVFLQWRNKYGMMAALAGVMIRGTFPVGQFIDVSWYVDALSQLGV
ncbi:MULTISPECIES: hypothetical protein [Paraburkholderia]|uniref:Trypsin-like peptidase domain-containing protein n=1 Tax=Paraburkholderia metrosideri TaxID=580937 RepID=A0ABW9E5Y0_9BURK